MTKIIIRRSLEFRLMLCSVALLAFSPVAKGDLLSEGREAFMKYDFGLASELYGKYEKSLKKTPNAAGEDLLDKYMHQLEIAENSLDNVQKIEIIDRIDVPASGFFNYIKLPANGGRLLNPDVSVLKNRNNESDFVFSTESGDLLLWSEKDADRGEVIMQSERLMDGSWEDPVEAGDILNDGGNARNPFLLSDGLTLYFASDGEGSMGGFDLFVATRDAASGEFRQPIALGYPFNSPFDEYLMAIDEVNGIGWWVSDRNCLDDKVSVYVFKTNDVRKNYVSEEEEDIISLARIDDIHVTQNENTDYAKILKDIDLRSRSNGQSAEAEFIFPLPGGRVAKRLSDFRSASAKRNMQQYLQALEDHNALEKKLAGLRMQYHAIDKKKSSATALKNQILELEKKRDWQSDKLKKMRNTIISAELNN
ncbi:MAG: hypothetical protein K2K45_05480 [Muribaculaceae bacterium]|nr:hypothetical protein [Muribaculaceae bacterium]